MAQQRGGSPPVPPNLEAVKNVIHCILCTNKGAITLDALARDYLTIDNTPLPFRQLGFTSIEEFMKSIPDVVNLSYVGGVCKVRPVPKAASKHIIDLVAGQKNSTKRGKLQRTVTSNSKPNHQNSRPIAPRFNVANTARQAPWSQPYIPPVGKGQPAHVFRQWEPVAAAALQAAQIFRPGQAALLHEFRPTMPPQPPVQQNQQVQPTQQVNKAQPAQPKSTKPSLPAQPTVERKVTFALEPQNQARPVSPSVQQAFSYDKASTTPENQRSKLARFVKLHKLAEPKYESMTMKRGQFVATVDVTFNNEIIKGRCFPDTFPTKEEAFEKAAEEALNELEAKFEASLANLPVTTNKTLLAKRVFDLVGKSPQSGFLSEVISKMYVDEHREKMPPDWIEQVRSTTDSLKFELMKGTGEKTNYIITISKTKSVSPPPPVTEVAESAQATACEQFDEWPVNVQVVLPNAQVGMRRMDQSKEWDEVMTELECHYDEKKESLKPVPVESLKRGILYVAIIEGAWYRAEFNDFVGEKKEKASVTLVDLADSEAIPPGDIYPLEERFARLARQGILCSLHGLSAFVDSEIAVRALIELLINRQHQSCTAQVVSRDPLSVVLVSESDGRVEYMNEKVLEICAEQAQSAPLRMGTLTQKAVISYVSPSCDIYLLRDTPQQNAVDALVSLVAKRVDCEADAASDLSGKKLFLGLSEKRDWCRMRLCTIDGKVRVQLVDFGDIEDVADKTLIDLETVSPVLARLPDQAIKVVLARVPPAGKVFNERAVDVLRKIIPPEANVLARVVEIAGDGQAVVELFERLPDGKMVTVNGSLELDETIFKPAEAPVRKISAHSKNGDVTQRPGTRPPGSRESSTGSPSPVESDPVTVSVPEADIPPIDKERADKPIQVQVLNASNPHHFYVQSMLSSQALSALTRRMQELFVEEIADQPDSVAVGGFYAALHAKTQTYRRVQVIRKLGSDCQVVFVDYGDMNVVAASDLKTLHQDLAELPAQAIKAKLHGVKPIDGDWSPLGAFFFQKAVGDKVLSSYVTEVLPDKTVVLELIDSIEGQDSSIAQLLIDNSHATSA